MLPDFPDEKKRIMEVMNYRLKQLTKRDPLLGNVREGNFFEGDRWTTVHENGEIEESQFTEIKEGFPINEAEIIEKGPQSLFDNQIKLSQKIVQKQQEMFFKKANEVIEKTGNKSDAKGEPLSPKLILELLDKTEIDFDHLGRPRMPALVLSPNLANYMKEKIPQWEADPENKKRFDELIEKKRKEWNDRESHRKLVD